MEETAEEKKPVGEILNEAVDELMEEEMTPQDALNALVSMTEKGLTTVAELRGISTDELEAVYALAYDYYRVGNYDSAETLFRFLTVMDHFNEKYWMGMAAVHQVKKRFKEALQIYAFVAVTLNVKNVNASYYAAECYLATGDVANATSALEHVKAFADAKTEEGREILSKAARLEKVVKSKGEGVKG